ncbi:sialate O-acetylesterase [Bifidobacterium avesanii]|uniref:9-O-acetylesterase n=1 Tax=Bifidobacterium avesanii TaxID=1798157 RepID=A0A7K3TKX0_9BIFI|nr:sialate O-acetylesterase [Bifidobacterium avesanii]KAB8287563.1 sialic acid-specific 9-O-acetylesterase [Bifidobacterium avesanii]NEG79304.1 9-O-acetylesterase [Bifidobacterium avesanii]
MTNHLHVSPLFGDGAVLQRGKSIRIWGEALPEALVRVSIDGVEASAAADGIGAWQAVLPPHPAGGPHTLTVTSGGETFVAHDVLYGDVWVLGGQSNMQLWMGRLAERYPDEVAQAKDDRVRCFIVPEVEDFHGPREALGGGSWLVEGRDDYVSVSGAGYFFAKRLREHVDVPIGLLQTAIGGTTIETWMGEAWLNRIGLLPADHGKWRNDAYVKALADDYAAAFARYEAVVDAMDRGLAGDWASPAFDDSAWDEIALSDAYAPHPAFAGPAVVWIRKTIDVPERFVGKRARMFFGTLTDADECYVNGEPVGQTGYQYPPRNYEIPELTARTTIAFRLRIDTNSGGGFRFGKRHRIVCAGETIDVDAMGPWRFAVAARTPAAPVQTFLSRFAAACYNGMIAPIGRYGVKGALWYQGESNASRTPVRYADKMMALIQCWRETFGEPDLPFIYAQLPNIAFEARGWAKLRDEQRRALAVGNTAMTVLIGAGEDNDLHPLDKETVGSRFAYAAESLVYGASHDSMGPIVARAELIQGAITVHFAHCGGGLEAASGEELAFDVIDPRAGGRPGCETLRGYVSSPVTVTIPLPCDRLFGEDTRVRYAWGDSPRPVLRSREGLPASPFEIDLEV